MASVAEMLLHPGNIFKHPEEILRNNNLSNAEKIDILNRWAYDIRELEVAAEENMPGRGDSDANVGNLLQQINEALLQLGVATDEYEGSSTKHG